MITSIINFTNTYNLHKNIFPIENGREINVYLYKNCIFTGINLYYPNVLLFEKKESIDTVILPVIEKTMSLNQSTIYETPKYNMKYQIPNLRTNNIIYQNPVFYFVYNTDNYFHFLYDTLPYLISYFNIKQEIPNLKLLMQYPNSQKHEFYPFVLEFLEILGINTKEDIVLLNENKKYSEVYISTSYTHDIDSNLPPRKEIYEFYREIVIKVGPPQVPMPLKFYVSRRTWIHNKLDNIGTNYTTRRRLVNEDELVTHLEKQGFIEVFTENLTTIEKIQYFANATHIVGAIGGGISNVLFSPPTTKLETIVSPGFLEINQRFLYSLDCVDVVYNYNTKHVDEGDFKRYMRVKTKDGSIIGEIEEVHENTVIVSYNPGFQSGWNAKMEYKQIELKKDDIIALDKGLNSPWKLQSLQ